MKEKGLKGRVFMGRAAGWWLGQLPAFVAGAFAAVVVTGLATDLPGWLSSMLLTLSACMLGVLIGYGGGRDGKGVDDGKE